MKQDKGRFSVLFHPLILQNAQQRLRVLGFRKRWISLLLKAPSKALAMAEMIFAPGSCSVQPPRSFIRFAQEMSQLETSGYLICLSRILHNQEKKRQTALSFLMFWEREWSQGTARWTRQHPGSP